MAIQFLHWKELLLLGYKYDYDSEYENTRLIKFLVYEETVGVEGKHRSIFIILHKVKCVLIIIVWGMDTNMVISNEHKMGHMHFITSWKCQLDSQPQMGENHRGIRNKVYPKSSYQQKNHVLCFLPFLVLDSPMFHTWYVSYFLTVQTNQSLQF